MVSALACHERPAGQLDQADGERREREDEQQEADPEPQHIALVFDSHCPVV